MNLDLENTRRNLIAKRVAAGADTEIGHRCSNPIELLDNYAKVESEEQRAHIEAAIRKREHKRFLRCAPIYENTQAVLTEQPKTNGER